MASNQKYGAIVTTFNRINLLKECVDHLLNQRKVKFDNIIIVNNSSSDGTKEYLDGLEGDTVTAVHLSENGGGAGGFYVGICEALKTEVDYVLILDDDAIVDYDYLSSIDDVLKDEHTTNHGYSGTVITRDTINDKHRYNLSDRKIWSIEPVDLELYDKDRFEYDIGTFCGVVLPLSYIKKVGLPRKDFFISYDDTEFFMRLYIAGLRMINVNQAKLFHKEGMPKDPRLYDWRRYFSERNRIIVGLKYSEDRTRYLLLCVAKGFFKILRAGLWSIQINRYGEIKKNMVLNLDALTDGIRDVRIHEDKYRPKSEK